MVADIWIRIHLFRTAEDFKVNLDPFGRELEQYEQDGIIFPTARIIRPEKYLLERRQFDVSVENLTRRMPKWQKLELLLFGNRNDPWHDFDRELQNGDNPYIAQPKSMVFRPWNSYRVEIVTSNGEKYLTDNATHYYHYWQIYQVYELQTKYPIYAEYPWVYQMIKENDPHRADFLFPGNPAPLTEFYGRYDLYEVLSIYIHLYRFELNASANHSEQISLAMAAHANSILKRMNLEPSALYEFLSYLLHLESDYRGREKYLLANEISKDIDYLVSFISYAADATFDDIQNTLSKEVPDFVLKRLRHHDHRLLVNDIAQDDLTYLLSDYNKLFPESCLKNADVEAMIGFLDKSGLGIISSSIYYLVELMNQSEPIWFTSISMGLNNLLVGVESFLRELVINRKKSLNVKLNLYSYLCDLYKHEIWWARFEKRQNDLKRKHNEDNRLILSDLIENEKTSDAKTIFLVTLFARNLVLHRYIDQSEFYDNLYTYLYRCTCFALLYTWSYCNKTALI